MRMSRRYVGVVTSRLRVAVNSISATLRSTAASRHSTQQVSIIIEVRAAYIPDKG
jgi:hypothetical protein